MKHNLFRLAAVLLAVFLLASGCAVRAASGPSSGTSGSLPFADVSPSDWFYDDVKTAWESGLISGKSETAFAPDDSLTYAEAVKLAACMNQLYGTGSVSIPAEDGAAWYMPYVRYCESAGIIVCAYDWNAPADRSGYMEIFAAALPGGALSPINDIPDGSIPDLFSVTAGEYDAVYTLYRAGVAQGTGDTHACSPASPIRRCEVAAILTRMMFPESRLSFSMTAGDAVPASGGHVIETIGGITYVDGILIANKTYSLPRDYAPGGLTPECRTALDAMIAGAAQEGIGLYAVSAYRSWDYQEGLYNRYAERDGKEEADRYSARPGHSEHQTGLAIDLNSLDYAFADTPEGRWIAAHCHEYGFILRYPEGKEEVTGYRYEPWHVRYLGKEIAEKVAASGLCLEEYLGITSAYAD